MHALRKPGFEAQFHFAGGKFRKAPVRISVRNHEQVYIETYAFSREGLSDAAGADDRHGLAGDFISEQRMMRMPRAPLAGLNEFFRRVEFARDRAEDEQREFSSCFGQDVRSVAERY